MEILFIIIFSIIGYLVGSLNFAYLISKYIYKKDLRNYGSGNLGGTNAGRILGKPVGLIVIILDIFKSFLMVFLFHKININSSLFAGFFAVVGHCFPVFLNFKGGKGVASYLGFLISTALFIDIDIYLIVFLPVCCFLLTLSLTRYVSLSSIILSISACLISYFINSNIILSHLLLIMSILIILKHLSNIFRILKNKEPKISWLF